MLNYSSIEGGTKSRRKRLEWELAWQLNGREKGRVYEEEAETMGMAKWPQATLWRYLAVSLLSKTHIEL